MFHVALLATFDSPAISLGVRFFSSSRDLYPSFDPVLEFIAVVVLRVVLVLTAVAVLSSSRGSVAVGKTNPSTRTTPGSTNSKHTIQTTAACKRRGANAFISLSLSVSGTSRRKPSSPSTYDLFCALCNALSAEALLLAESLSRESHYNCAAFSLSPRRTPL